MNPKHPAIREIHTAWIAAVSAGDLDPLLDLMAEDALTVAPRSGGPDVELRGHRLTLYRKHPDGRWRLVRDAHTLVPERS